MRRREKVSSASAVAASLPRIICATRFSLRGLVRIARRKAEASLSASRRSAACLPISASSRLLVAGMAVEGAGRRELAEFVADHVLGHQHRDEFVAVIDPERQPDELREDRRAPRPRPDNLVAPRTTRLFRLLQHIAVDERAFPNRGCHALSPLLSRLLAAADDQPVRRLVLTRLLALGRLAPRRHRMPSPRRLAFAAAMRMVDRVHRDAAHRRPATEPAIAAGLADYDVLVIRVRHGSDRRAAFGAHHPHLAGGHAQERIALLASDQLYIGTGRTRDLAALARLHLDIVDDRAERHIPQRHRVAGLYVNPLAGNHRVT